MKERIKRFIKAVEFFQTGLIDADFISPLKARVPVGSFSLLLSSQLESRGDIQYLFDELDQLSDDIVRLIFSGFEEFPDILALLADRVWISELKAKEPHWEECQALCAEILAFAYTHKIPWLFAGAVRAKNWSYLTNILIILTKPSRPLMKPGKNWEKLIPRLTSQNPPFDFAGRSTSNVSIYGIELTNPCRQNI